MKQRLIGALITLSIVLLVIQFVGSRNKQVSQEQMIKEQVEKTLKKYENQIEELKKNKGN